MSSKSKKTFDPDIAVCSVSLCPMRKRPDETSEMISQLMFGEQCDVLNEEEGDWLHIRSRMDRYEGWVDSKMLCAHIQAYSSNMELYYSLEPSYPIIGDKDSKLITFGALLPGFDGIGFRFIGKKYHFSGQAVRSGDFSLTENVVEKLCKKFLNAPYLWGGKSPFGVDCSGLVQVVYRVLGVNLPRDASDQAKEGLTVDFIGESMTGDLAFFTKASNRISHVGVILEGERIIHASGKVRIDKLDHIGIFNQDCGMYTHRLRIVKRVL